jgi:AraC-like DNA-binding protein
MARNRQASAPQLLRSGGAELPLPAFYYLPVSDQIRSWDLYVTGVGQECYRAGDKYPETGHPSLYDFEWRSGRVLPEYAMILILEGSGEFELRNQPLTRCSAGDVLLVSPGQWHRYRPSASTGWSELWVCAGGEYLHRLRSRRLMFGQAKVALGARFHDTRRVIAEILDFVRTHPNVNSPLLTARVLEAIALIAEAGGGDVVEPVSPAGSDSHVADAIEFIWHNSHRPIQTKDVARAVNLAPRTLERRFAACHARAVHEEIEESRYLRARRLLIESTLPIKEIAYSTGFGEPKRMIELFRRRDGRTPSAVRHASAN